MKSVFILLVTMIISSTSHAELYDCVADLTYKDAANTGRIDDVLDGKKETFIYTIDTEVWTQKSFQKTFFPQEDRKVFLSIAVNAWGAPYYKAIHPNNPENKFMQEILIMDGTSWANIVALEQTTISVGQQLITKTSWFRIPFQGAQLFITLNIRCEMK